MSSHDRIAPRHVFEARILIRSFRGRNSTLSGWARDLSESGLGAFVGEQLEVGELVVLVVPLPPSGKHEITARVARKIGTQYGFQFTALSAEQRAAMQATLKEKPTVP